MEQDLKTWPSNGARTIAFDSKTGHLLAMASEIAGRGAAIPGSFTIIMVGK
jgi:hypothetical protein